MARPMREKRPARLLQPGGVRPPGEVSGPTGGGEGKGGPAENRPKRLTS